VRKRLFYSFASILLAISVVLVVWQGSFRLSAVEPSTSSQTLILWAVSTLIFVLMVTVGWILAREFIKLYVARQAKRPGSRIRTKLVVGAMLLSCVPVFFLVLWSYEVLNFNLKVWFTNPVDKQVQIYKEAAVMLDREVQDRLGVQAQLLAAQPAIRQLLNGGSRTPGMLERFAGQQGIDSVMITSPTGTPLDAWGPPVRPPDGRTAIATLSVKDGDRQLGTIALADSIPVDAAYALGQIKHFSNQWAQITGNRRFFRFLYLMLMVLITMFVLFIATWLARVLANRISTPITAILEAADEVRQGHLHHRVRVAAEDELAMLVTGFNQMTEALETGAHELERRNRFTEAILESIPTACFRSARTARSTGSTRRWVRSFRPHRSRVPPAWKISSPAKTPPKSNT
jgi:nitrogen fixation/metabolism regulation signal transduction histidine kinase